MKHHKAGPMPKPNWLWMSANKMPNTTPLKVRKSDKTNLSIAQIDPYSFCVFREFGKMVSLGNFKKI